MSAKTMMLTGALAMACAAFAADTSEPFFLFVNPDQSSFWHTAPDHVITLPINYPSSATKASLKVEGVMYEQTYNDITTSTYQLTLPAATKPYEENTYKLTLTFDAGEPQKAVVSVIDGMLAGGAGATRCLSTSARAWVVPPRVRMTLPIPYGTTSLERKVGDSAYVPVDTGLNGTQGFCTLRSGADEYVLTVGEQEYVAQFEQARGLILLVR